MLTRHTRANLDAQCDPSTCRHEQDDSKRLDDELTGHRKPITFENGGVEAVQCGPSTGRHQDDSKRLDDELTVVIGNTSSSRMVAALGVKADQAYQSERGCTVWS